MPDTSRLLNVSSSPRELMGRKLDDFKIQEYTEVYRTDFDGRKSQVLGHFKDASIAKAFAANQTDSGYCKTEPVLLLTNGKDGFLLGGPALLVDDEKAALEIKEAALKKLTSDERKILGI